MSDDGPAYRLGDGRVNPAYNRWYRAKNRTAVAAQRKRYRDQGGGREYVAAYRERNKERLAAWARKYWREHREKGLGANREWVRRNPERHKEIAKGVKRRMMERLPDHYIVQLLGVPRAIVPEALIEAKRAELKLRRLCRESKISKN